MRRDISGRRCFICDYCADVRVDYYIEDNIERKLHDYRINIIIDNHDSLCAVTANKKALLARRLSIVRLMVIDWLTWVNQHARSTTWHQCKLCKLWAHYNVMAIDQHWRQWDESGRRTNWQSSYSTQAANDIISLHQPAVPPVLNVNHATCEHFHTVE